MTQSPTLKQYKYKAFISYSHAADGRLAPTLQSALHRFAKPWNRLRAMRIFRDQTGLGLTPALWDSIQKALEESEYFLLLASPEAAQSAWVDREVEYWLKARSSSRLLIILTDGDLRWNGSDFDWTHTDSLPRRLERAFQDEPKHLDLRWARTAIDLSLRQPQFLEAVATLASTLQGQPLDTLIGEDVQQHRKTRLLTRAAVITLLALLASALIAALLAIRQRNIAEHERNRAREQQVIAEEQREQGRQRLVRLNVANGLKLVDEGDLSGGLLWFTEALRLEPDGSRGQAQQRLRLNSVLRQHPALHQVWSTDQGFPRFSRDGRYVFVDTDQGERRIWEVNSGLAVTLPKEIKGRVLAMDFGEKGKRVVTETDRGVRVWDGQTGRELFALPAAGVKNANFSSDGKILVAAHADQTARLWDAQTGNQIQAFAHDQEVLAVELSRDAKRLLTMANKTIRVWDVGTRTSQVFKHERDVGFADLSAQGKWLLTLNDERGLRVWNVATGDSRSWLGDWGVLENAELSPDGKHVVMVPAHGGTARIWDLEADREVASVQHQGFILRAGFSPDGRQLVTAATDATARVWNVQSGVALSPPLHHDDTVRGAGFSPDGNRLATTTASGLVRVWNLEPRSAVVLKHNDYVRSAEFTAGQKLLTATHSGARLWDVEAKTSLALDLTTQLYHASVSPSGRWVATACEDGKACVWDAQSGKNLAVLTHRKRVNHAAFSPDETLLAAASGERLWLWDLRTRRTVADFQHDSPVLYSEFSRDGKRVLSVDFGGTVHVWEISKRDEAPHLRRPDVNLARFSPDCAFLAATSGVNVQIWDVVSGARRAALPAQDYRLTALAFSPDSSLLLTANQGGTARVWDARTGAAVTPPLQHGASVMSATFSPDGSQVLTASEDHTARLWDAATGSALIPPLRHNDAVRVASFGAGGRSIVTGSHDETARVWDLSASDSLFSDSSPSEDQLLLSQLVSSRRIDETGAVVALGAAEFQAAWRKIQALRAGKH